MQCQVYCTALSYDLKPLQESLSRLYGVKKTDNVIRIEIPAETTLGHIFFFSYGTFACWDIKPEIIDAVRAEIKPFENYPLDVSEIDTYSYSYGKKVAFLDDELILPEDSTELKLAFSQPLAQSAKLSTFELTIQNIFRKTKHLPEHLAKYGNIPLSRRQIRQQIGQLFLERSSINLSLDILDTPSFFWEHPHLENLYHNMAGQLDLEERTHSLNQQLDVLHDLFEMLGSELKDKHSHRLEWAIIYLIIIEVLLLLFHDVLNVI